MKLIRLTDLKGNPVYLNVDSIGVIEVPSDPGGVEIDGRRFAEDFHSVVQAVLSSTGSNVINPKEGP